MKKRIKIAIHPDKMKLVQYDEYERDGYYYFKGKLVARPKDHLICGVFNINKFLKE